MQVEVEFGNLLAKRRPGQRRVEAYDVALRLVSNPAQDVSARAVGPRQAHEPAPSGVHWPRTEAKSLEVGMKGEEDSLPASLAAGGSDGVGVRLVGRIKQASSGALLVDLVVDQIRRVLAVAAIVVYGPGLLFWFLVHPLAHF